MLRKVLVIACCVVSICSVLGLVDNLTYDGVKVAAESIEGEANDILSDTNAIAVFAWVVEDYFAGYEIETNFVERIDQSGNPTGAYELWYKAYDIVIVNGVEYVDIRHEEALTISTRDNPLTHTEAAQRYDKILYAIEPLIEISRQAYSGAFAEILNALQYIAFCGAMVWSVLSIVMLILFDVVGAAWACVRAAFYLVGLSSSV